MGDISDNSVLWSLCHKDSRHPHYQDNYGWEVDELGETPPTPRQNCACDNCFYGRDRLALRIFNLEEALEEAIGYADVRFADVRFNVKGIQQVLQKGIG